MISDPKPPPEVVTGLFFGRSREKSNPVPPPDLWMSAAFFSVPKIASILSSTGKTKQAANWPNGRPAFIRVVEFGKNFNSAMIL